MMWGMIERINCCLVNYDIGGEGIRESIEVGRVAGDSKALVIGYCSDAQG